MQGGPWLKLLPTPQLRHRRKFLDVCHGQGQCLTKTMWQSTTVVINIDVLETCFGSGPRSDQYDSQVEDAQNPFPKPDDEENGKPKLRRSNHVTHTDTQETLVVQTPPHRLRVKSPSTDPSAVHAALRRKGTVDIEGTEARKTRAAETQRSLSAEFAAAKDDAKKTKKDTQAAAHNARRDKKHSNSSSDSKKNKLIDLGSAPPKKKPKTAEEKKKEADEKKQAAYEVKDHATARSSGDPFVSSDGVQGKPEKSKANKKPKQDCIETSPNSSSKKPVTESKPRSKASSTATSNDKEKDKDNTSQECNHDDKKDPSHSKKVAHKLYMRFWRSIQSPSLRSDKCQATTPAHEIVLNSTAPYIMSSLRSCRANGDQECICKIQVLLWPQFVYAQYSSVCAGIHHTMHVKHASGKEAMSSLYDDFIGCSGEWKNSAILKTIRNLHKNGRRAVRRWMTKSQLETHFKDPKMVKALILRKESDPELLANEVRDHPDIPGYLTAFMHTLYHSCDTDTDNDQGVRQYLVLVEEEEVAEDSNEIENLFRMEDAQSVGSSSDSDDSEAGP